MSRLARLVSAACAAVLIAACGGGGGAALVDAIDTYLGTWTTACLIDAGTGRSERLVFTAVKTGVNQASFATTATAFPNASCTPPADIASSVVETGVIDGPATVPFPGVDRLTFTVPGLAPAKDIAFVNGNQLQFGDDLSPLDAQGYPTALDTSTTFFRL